MPKDTVLVYSPTKTQESLPCYMSFCKLTLLLLSSRVGVYFPFCWVWAGLWLALISGRWWECRYVTSQSHAFMDFANSRGFVVVVLLETWDKYAIKKIPASHVPLYVTLWTGAQQVPLSMGLSRREYWSGVPFPPPRDLPDIGIESTSPALAIEFFTTELTRKPHLWAVTTHWSVLVTGDPYILSGASHTTSWTKRKERKKQLQRSCGVENKMRCCINENCPNYSKWSLLLLHFCLKNFW